MSLLGDVCLTCGQHRSNHMMKHVFAGAFETFASVSPTPQKKYKPPYKFECIYCKSTNVIPLTNDGGSQQLCTKCNKSYSVIKN